MADECMENTLDGPPADGKPEDQQQQRASPLVEVKEEPQDETDQWIFASEEVIDLVTPEPESQLEVLKMTEPARGLAAPQDTPTIEANVEKPQRDPTIYEQVLAKQKRLADKFRTNQQAKQPEIPAQVPSESPGDGEDEDEEDPAARFEELKKEYERKRRANKLSIEDELTFLRQEGIENSRRLKQQQDDEFKALELADVEREGSGLFVSDNEAPSRPDEDSDEGLQTSKKRGRKRAAGEDNGEEKSRKRGKKEKATAADKKSKQTSTMTKTKSTRPSAAPRKTKSKSTKHVGHNMTNESSLLSADVFKDAKATAGLANQPGFSNQTRRPGAFKQLVVGMDPESKPIARNDMKKLDNAIKEFTGQGSVTPSPDGNWSVKGMKTSLKHYQVLGASFMRQKERSAETPSGILADEMGLGKTIMMLANIINGKPSPNSRGPRATLIVASPALVTQWQAEIRSHCYTHREHKHGVGRVIAYRTGSHLESNDAYELLETADIVLTTWHEVRKSYPDTTMPDELVTAAQKDEHWKGVWEKDRGMLHRLKFLRVCLDEATAISNHLSKTSLAARALQGKHYWAITGTPIQNSTREFYPIFRFLRVPQVSSFKTFTQNFCSEDSDSKERLSVLLRRFMIRRSHSDRLFNAKLLSLPVPHQHTLWIELNQIERALYELIKKRYILQINKMSKDGGILKKFSSVWAMITRLRQICAHPLLVFSSCLDLLTREDYEHLNRITESEEKMNDEGAALLFHLRNVLRGSKDAETIEGGIGSGVLTENEAVVVGTVDVGATEGSVGGKHGQNFRIRKYLEEFKKSEKWEEVKDRATCCGCRQSPYDPYVTSCDHIYCASCLQDLSHLSARRGHEKTQCSECGTEYVSARSCIDGFETIQARESPDSTEDQSQPPKKSSKSKKKQNEIDYLSIRGEILPSAKTMATKAAILEWIEEDQDVKTIIYSQFIDFLRIMSKVCMGEGWGFNFYTGQMSHESRDKSLHDFQTNRKKKILLASLRCGGVGLNITAASRVICVDPWWNASSESQAFCRVFRIGQQKETRMTRIVARNTIDEAMMNIKRRKKIEIDEAMESSKLKESLTVPDLLRLFGPVGEDSNRQPFIYTDENDESEYPRIPNVDKEDDDRHMGNEE